MTAPLDIIFFFGRIFAPLYKLIMIGREYCYSHGLFSSKKLSVPVISVGNLTMGGTGKTPMVIYLGQLFAGKRQIAIVSRGYGGKAKGKINIVADERAVLLSSVEAGDEPRLIADTLSGVPVLTGGKRAVIAEHAVRKMGASLIIMDDGFQHMALERDVDVVLFSASTLLGNGWVCPGGPLREPFSALSRADIFVITGVDPINLTSVDVFRNMLKEKFPATPLFLGEYAVTGISCANGLAVDLDGRVKETPLYAFCGIATPKSFLNSLEVEKIQIKGLKCFDDHHSFSQDDILLMEKEAQATGCTGFITTEKDYVKLRDYSFSLPLYVLRVALRMSPEFDACLFDKLLLATDTHRYTHRYTRAV